MSIQVFYNAGWQVIVNFVPVGRFCNIPKFALSKLSKNKLVWYFVFLALAQAV